MPFQFQVVDKISPPPMTLTVEQVQEHLAAKLNTNRCVYDNERTNVEKFVQDIESACATLMRRGEKIQAIKLLKTIFPLGLKEAKDYLENKYGE